MKETMSRFTIDPWLRAIAAIALAMALGPAWALDAAQARAIAVGDGDARIAALDAAVERADPGLAAFAQALLDDAVKTTATGVYVVRDDRVTDAATGAPARLPGDAEDVTSNNRMRGALQAALSGLRLLSKDAGQRHAAIAALSKADPDPALLPVLDKAWAAETDEQAKRQLDRLRAALRIAAPEPAQRRQAIEALARSDEPAVRALLQARLAPDGEADPALRAALAQALAQVDGRLAWGERLGVLFAGVSLGSILLLVALGLAITYGLMGVINMAHGELMMIGAYATWLVQNLVRHWAPQWFDAYLVFAVPASFLAAAGVGAVLERGVIRFLYGRPLETLLATWGISLVLMQAVRTLFGAQNVEVENPSWMSGGIAVASNLVLPWNRLAIVAFALLVLGATALVIGRTRLGLFVRGVTQNRRMASCTGIDTARTDTLAFALGAGIAGLAGCALSQVGNVGPDLGQGYIVDAFMVVVLGGVGQLAGTVLAALGLGLVNKVLEGVAGAVLAKILVLVFIVVFIQKRPQGLFALKGRSAES
jgi:urea transport system permease protein